MRSYEEYLKIKEDYSKRTEDDIENCKNTEVPQHILLSKTVSDLLEEEGDYISANETFYFRERLVNKLMYFAFLQGQRQFEARSYNEGWSDCIKDIKEYIES
jgi:hypothetical protein